MKLVYFIHEKRVTADKIWFLSDQTHTLAMFDHTKKHE